MSPQLQLSTALGHWPPWGTGAGPTWVGCEHLSPHSRLHSNHLFCDCHLAWLSQWLRQRPTIGLFTQCSGPAALRSLNVAEVQKSEFSCSGGCMSCQAYCCCPRPLSLSELVLPS